MKNLIKILTVALALFAVVSCEEFLNRPSEDALSNATYYSNDTQVEQSVNYLYSAPWNDLTRFVI